MSKFLKVMIVLLTIAAMAAPAFAEDRLSLAGSMQVRGFLIQNDNGTTDTTHAWNDQRLRIGGKIAVAEGVSVNFRFDASESDENSSNDVAWGGSTSTGYAPYSHRRADIQFDKAYLQIEKMGYTLTAGQQYFGGFGTGRLVDTVGTGFVVKRGPVTLLHIKQMDSDNGNDGLTKTPFNETTLTAAKFVFKNDTMSLTPMLSYTFARDTDISRLGLGVNGATKLGAISLKGELVMFTGENAAGADEKGLQLYLDGSTAISDTVTVGGVLLYAMGQDGGDVQVTSQAMPIFADFLPLDYGYFSADVVTELNTFDPSGAGAGVIALQGYADVKINDEIMTKFAAAYLTTEDDNTSDFSGFILNANLGYALMKNTSLNTHVNYKALDNNGTDMSNASLMSALTVKF